MENFQNNSLATGLRLCKQFLSPTPSLLAIWFLILDQPHVTLKDRTGPYQYSQRRLHHLIIIPVAVSRCIRSHKAKVVSQPQVIDCLLPLGVMSPFNFCLEVLIANHRVSGLFVHLQSVFGILPVLTRNTREVGPL